MSIRPDVVMKHEPVELGNLLANTIGSVVDAQERLDRYTEQRRQAYENAPKGTLALPPLWYTFSNVSVELELSARVGKVVASQSKKPQPHLLCKTLDPSTVSLYGREAATGMKIKVELQPQGFVPIKQTRSTNNNSTETEGEE